MSWSAAVYPYFCIQHNCFSSFPSCVVLLFTKNISTNAADALRPFCSLVKAEWLESIMPRTYFLSSIMISAKNNVHKTESVPPPLKTQWKNPAKLQTSRWVRASSVVRACQHSLSFIRLGGCVVLSSNQATRTSKPVYILVRYCRWHLHPSVNGWVVGAWTNTKEQWVLITSTCLCK